LARTALALLGRLPLSASLGVARLLDMAVPKLRRSARTNLALAGLPEPDKTIDGVFASLGRLLFYYARFPSRNKANIGQWIEYEGFEHYQQAKARGKGVLFATAHMGNWELSAFAHALMTEPMHVVVRPLDNPILDAIVRARRSLSGNHILDKRDFLRRILQALANNEPVGILIDQNTLPEQGAFVPFFGTLACTGTTFVKLAHKTGAAVIPGYALWDEARGKHILRFDPVFEMSGDLLADTAALTKHFEGVIRRNPDQWLWIHRRWKTRPEGDPPLY
jgi:Kdo2-lipid IVA lauroyltransferase/acyltransferase